MKHCIHCGYDLHAHDIGEACPECGRLIRRMAAGPPPRGWLGRGATLLAVALPLLWLVFGRHGTVYMLYAFGVLAPLLLGVAILQYRRTRRRNHLPSLILAGLASIGPLFTLICFLFVFVYGRSSNVAQMAGNSGFDYWSFWFHAWPWMFFGNPVCVILAAASCAAPPYRWRYAAAWALPLIVLVGAVATAHLAMLAMPDA